MASLVIKIEGFKYKIFDQVPVAAPGQSILLYRSTDGLNGSMLIDGMYTPYSSDVRRGKFDTKVTFSMDIQSLQIQDKVLIEGHICYFMININIKYKLRNVREYYFNESGSFEKRIESHVKDFNYDNNSKFTLYQERDLQKKLNDDINSNLQQFSYLDFTNVTVEVKLDDEALKLVESDREKRRIMYITKNDSDMKILKNEEQMRVKESERKLDLTKSLSFAELVQQYGELAPMMKEYFDGKIDGQQLDQRIREKKREDIQYITDGLKNDIVSEEFAQQEFVKKITGKSPSQDQVLNIGKDDDIASDKPSKFVEVQEVGDDDYL